MRELALDTETTGLDPNAGGDRIVEIAAVEMVDRVATGKVFYALLDPEMDIHPDAVRIHGHTRDSLAGKPKFADVVVDLLDHLGDSPIVAHNAAFDIAFINAELDRLWLGPIEPDRIVDTLALARAKFPGKSNSLDALCDRFRISRTHRFRHGALLDAELLVEVYAELRGARQQELSFDVEAEPEIGVTDYSNRPRRLIVIDRALIQAHAGFVKTLGPAAIWNQFTETERKVA